MPIELSAAQEEKAKEALRRLQNGEISHPTDIVDSWEAKPSVRNLERVGEEYMEVPVARIVGTEPINTDRLEQRRLAKALKRLHNGTYEPDRRPPHLARIEGEYYVSSDGNHRSLAHKLVGLETMYAEVTMYQ